VTMDLTPLERRLLELVAGESWPGWRVDGVKVVSRENTGVGRFVYWIDEANQPLRVGRYGAGYAFITLPHVPDGMGFVVEIDSAVNRRLEIAAFGAPWDGKEEGWKIE